MALVEVELKGSKDALTYEEAVWLLENYRNPMVRISARARGGYGSNWMRARLIRVEKNYAIVVPSGHKKEEKVEYRHLKKWNMKLHENGKKTIATLGDFMSTTTDITPSAASDSHKDTEQSSASGQHRFPPKYGEDVYAEIRRLLAMDKTISEIQVITQIPKGSIHYMVAKAQGHEYQPKKRIVTAVKPNIEIVEEVAETKSRREYNSYSKETAIACAQDRLRRYGYDEIAKRNNVPVNYAYKLVARGIKILDKEKANAQNVTVPAPQPVSPIAATAVISATLPPVTAPKNEAEKVLAAIRGILSAPISAEAKLMSIEALTI